MVKVKEIMKRYVITVDPDASIADVSRIMTNNRVGSLVVMEKNKPVGIVTDSDIVSIVAEGKSPKKVKIRDLKKQGFISATPNDTMMHVIKLMVKNGVKRVPIIENGKLEGIVSDKEILLVSPELIEVMSERLRSRVGMVARPRQTISGICEDCGNYSEELRSSSGRWLCEDCR
jgi:CBS domain-containing protein